MDATRHQERNEEDTMTMPPNPTPVYLSDDDWQTIARELRDSRTKMLETERDFASYTHVAHAARVETQRIGAVIERLKAQIEIEEP